MFKNFVNKNSYGLYKKIKSKINIILFFILAILFIWIFISAILGIGSKEESEVTNQSSYRPAETVIDGDDIDETVYEKEESIINTFVNYCNEGKIAEAYDMLSSDCKEALYPDVTTFEQNYYNTIFTEKRICNLQAWINADDYTTYRVRFTDDIMSTGDYENSNKFQDYITIVKTSDDKEYLSINKYISKENFQNVKAETEELDIEVRSVEKYIDYVDYTFSVKNKSDKTILLDSTKNIADTMYITTNSDRTRVSDYNNINILNFKVEPYNTEMIKIRYNKAAGSDDEDKEIHFSNIIKDYDLYMQDMNHYNDIIELVIDL